MSHRRSEIGRADAEKLLPGIERVSVLCSEGAGGGYAFDIGQQQAAGSQGNDSLDVAHPERRACKRGQARRNFSGRRHAKRRQPQQRCSGDRQRDNSKRDRLSRQQAFAKHDEHDRDNPDDENEVLHLPELSGQQEHALEKIVASAFHAEKAWQLRHGDRQAGAGLETHENAVADQLDERAQSQQPRQQAQPCDREGDEAGDLGVALRVPLGHGAHRSGNHERDGGSRPDGELARGPEQGIAETAQQIAVDADLRRQACKARIGQGNRNRVGRQGYPGDDIAGRSRTVGIQPTNGPAETTTASLSRSGVSSNPPCATSHQLL